MFKKLIFIILFIIIGITVGALYYLNDAFYQPIDPGSKEVQLFKVQKTSTKNLAADLQQAGLIKSPLAFEIYCKVKKIQLQSGQYELKTSMSIASIASKISSGDVAKLKVTIPEGWKISQISDRLEAGKIVKKVDFQKAADGQEGYLFPDTYFIPSGTSADNIVSL